MIKKVLCCLIAIILTVCMSSVVMAADDFVSPSGDNYWSIYITTNGDGGYATADPLYVLKGEVTALNAYAYDGYEFGFWTIEGEFEWVEGDAYSSYAVIRPLGPIDIHANFAGTGANRDVSTVSPKTGIGSELIFAAMAVVVTVSAAAVVYTGKKYFAEK